MQHAARFLLVGTMNPEEGELRPQLLDRFGLTVEVAATREPGRARRGGPPPVRRRRRPGRLRRAVGRRRGRAGRPDRRRPRAAAPGRARRRRAARRSPTVCAAFDVDGLRADIVTARAAIAHAAWSGRTEVTEDDVRVAARLALPHRRRRNPFDAPGLDERAPRAGPGRRRGPPTSPTTPSRGRRAGRRRRRPGDAADAGRRRRTRRTGRRQAGPDEAGQRGPGSPPSGRPRRSSRPGRTPGSAAQPGTRAPPSSPRPPPTRPSRPVAVAAGVPGRARRGRSPVPQRARARGRVIGSRRPDGRLGPLHLAATAARRRPAPAGPRPRRAGPAAAPRGPAARPVREGREGNLVLFVVDASGLDGRPARMGAVKGAVLSLLTDAYQRRDKVGLVTFRGAGAELALPPTWSVEAAAARLTDLPTGGRTPLAAGLLRAARGAAGRAGPRPAPPSAARRGHRRPGHRRARPDHRRPPRAGLLPPPDGGVVVDCESGHVRLGLARRLGRRLGARRRCAWTSCRRTRCRRGPRDRPDRPAA